MRRATIHRAGNTGWKALLCTAVWFGLLASAGAQAPNNVATRNGVGDQPTCQYGYYGYAPYACAPRGFYGPDYFYNGIFVGVGPWADWGYTHGWGDHRFNRGVARAVPETAPPTTVVKPPVAPTPVAAPVPALRHEAPIAALPVGRGSSLGAARPGAAIGHSSAAIMPVAHGAVGTGAASHGATSVEATHAAADRGVVAPHSSVVAAHPSAVVAGRSNGTTHTSAAHGGHPSGPYRVPAPTSIGLYHPPPP